MVSERVEKKWENLINFNQISQKIKKKHLAFHDFPQISFSFYAKLTLKQFPQKECRTQIEPSKISFVDNPQITGLGWPLSLPRLCQIENGKQGEIRHCSLLSEYLDSLKDIYNNYIIFM